MYVGMFETRPLKIILKCFHENYSDLFKKNKTVSSFVLKGLERILLWYLREKVIAKALESLHAYTRGLSTESAEVLDYVESSFCRMKKTDCFQP